MGFHAALADRVGWVERSATHQSEAQPIIRPKERHVGSATHHPSEGTPRVHTITRCLAAFLLLTSATASAQIKIDVTLPLTGPAASLGIPERDVIALLPREIGGQKIEYIALDDASATTGAVKNAVPNGITTMTPEDHLGLDQRSRVMVQIVGGKWALER
jgi:hypothetical protein